MKNIYILAAGLFSLLAACNKDDSTATSGPLAEVTVTGLAESYALYTHRDTLKIAPGVLNEQDFDYYWTLFSASTTAGQGLVKADTLARTKDLSYAVLKDPGDYLIVFNVRHKESGVTRQFERNINISTLTMNGWYLVKDNAGKTDMDFIYPSGRIDNWIANFNKGNNLDGNAVKAIFVPLFKMSPTSQVSFPTLMVLSANDAAIYRVDNGSMVMNFDNMFFTKPATRRPQAVFQPSATSNLGFINDGRAYYLTKGTLFGNMPLTYNNTSYTNLSPVTASVAMDLGFNFFSKSVFCYSGASFAELSNNNGGNRLKNMNANIEWMAGYTGIRSIALLLFRNPQDTGYLYKLDAHYGQLIGSGTMFMATDTLKPEHTLMHADLRAGYYDVDIIYYSVGNNIYLTDVASMQEALQFTLPADETVTCMQHIKYPQPTSTAPSTVNYIAIATYKAGRYKVYLHTISSTGTLQALPQANFEGEGRVNTVIYMEQGNGSRVF